MIVLWSALFVAGIVAAALASRKAVTAALSASEATGLSAGFVGITLLAIGTDLPEIANSIVAALSRHGDLAVGDSAGSAFTQVTLVLALLCLMAPVRADRPTIAAIGLLTVAALALDAYLVRDGVFSRVDGLLLINSWFIGIVAVQQVRRGTPSARRTVSREALRHAGAALGWLAVVGVAATVVVQSFVRITDAFGVPELIASALVLSLGTSMPELVVDGTAIRRGATALALGDLFGSSLVDATIAIGSGPAIRATVVSSGAGLTCLIAAGGVLAATLVTISAREHRFRSAGELFVVYALTTAALIAFTA